MNGYLFALTLVGLLGCALAAGVFFAFSSFVMRALGRLPAGEGIAAMQSINVAAISVAFMLQLFGTALVVAVLAAWAVVEWGEAFAPYLLAGAALYLLGVIGTTAAYNVPRNNALATLEPASPDAAASWARYLREWTAGNHVRTVAGLAATAALALAVRVG
jgi:uncharacterized membrane protein